MLDSVEQPVKEETVRNRKRVGKMEWSMSRKKKGREKQNRNEKKKGEKKRERERKREARLGLGAFQLPRVRGRFSPVSCSLLITVCALGSSSLKWFAAN